MEPEKRIQLIRMIEKIDRNPEFSEKLGIRDKSKFEIKKEQK